MRRLGIAVLVVFALVVGASCTYKDDVPGTMQTKAGKIAELLSDGKFKDVRDDFDKTMRKDVSEAQLRRLWSKLTEEYGQYRGHGTARRLASPPRDKKLLVFELPIDFSKGKATEKITFHRDGKIQALAFDS